MEISRKQFNRIANTPCNECWICEDIIQHSKTTADDRYNIDDKYLSNNPDIKEHLNQIIN